MVQIQCQSCDRKLRVGDEAIGKKVRCPCGAQIPVTAPSATASRDPNSTISSNAKLNQTGVASPSIANFVHECQCGRKLRVAQSDKVKSAKCPCGESFQIPSTNQPPTKRQSSPAIAPTKIKTVVVTATPTAVPVATPIENIGANWERDIPAPSFGTPLPAYSGSTNFASGSSISPSNYNANAYADQSTKQSSVNPYLAQAVQERYERPARQESFFDGTVIGGVITMLVAVVWFLGGLAAGYIFFYPPVMFVLGLIAVIKGLLD
jgi:hypothetical protein